MPTPLTSLLQSKLSSCSTRVRTWDIPEPKKQKSARHFSTNRRPTKAKQWPRPLKSIFPNFILPRNAPISCLLCLFPAINSVAEELYFIMLLNSRVRSILAIFNWPVRKTHPESHTYQSGFKLPSLFYRLFFWMTHCLGQEPSVFLHSWEVHICWTISRIKMKTPAKYIPLSQTPTTRSRKGEEPFLLLEAALDLLGTVF